MNTHPIDPVCLIHGKRMSEHDCLYCCLCYKTLTPEQCHELPDGSREDVCNECAADEQKRIAMKRQLDNADSGSIITS